eukprot:GHVS01039611.1.p1 GENE.GHVS01039611.1~~GHVS01039611.1.p1  ORF type:complete len:129 (+),score=7.50 GHVS01039611.1:112-498(+)
MDSMLSMHQLQERLSGMSLWTRERRRDEAGVTGLGHAIGCTTSSVWKQTYHRELYLSPLSGSTIGSSQLMSMCSVNEEAGWQPSSRGSSDRFFKMIDRAPTLVSKATEKPFLLSIGLQEILRATVANL